MTYCFRSQRQRRGRIELHTLTVGSLILSLNTTMYTIELFYTKLLTFEKKFKPGYHFTKAFREHKELLNFSETAPRIRVET